MNTFTHTTAAVSSMGRENIHAEHLLVHSFGTNCEPLSLQDQARELRIQAEGLLLEADMLDWQRTGDFGAHGSADRHFTQMRDLIASRPKAFVVRLEEERGLRHG